MSADGTVSLLWFVAIETVAVSTVVGVSYLFSGRRKEGPRRRDLQARTADAVHMPVDYLQPGPRKLKEIPLGDEVWISFTDVEVDLQGRTFVNLDARVEEEGFSRVRVRLEREGAILTLFKEDSFKFTPRRPFPSLRANSLPVIEIRQEASRRRRVTSE